MRFASARRSAFLRRAARFLTLSLPWLCPIIPNTLPLTSNLKHQKFFGDRYARPARPRLFSGGAVENAAHFALGEIEDDAAVDRTHDKGAGIVCFAIDMLGVSLTRGALRVPDLDALSGRKRARPGCDNVGDRLDS